MSWHITSMCQSHAKTIYFFFELPLSCVGFYRHTITPEQFDISVRFDRDCCVFTPSSSYAALARAVRVFSLFSQFIAINRPHDDAARSNQGRPDRHGLMHDIVHARGRNAFMSIFRLIFTRQQTSSPHNVHSSLYVNENRPRNRWRTCTFLWQISRWRCLNTI